MTSHSFDHRLVKAIFVCAMTTALSCGTQDHPETKNPKLRPIANSAGQKQEKTVAPSRPGVESPIIKPQDRKDPPVANVPTEPLIVESISCEGFGGDMFNFKKPIFFGAKCDIYAQIPKSFPQSDDVEREWQIKVDETRCWYLDKYAKVKLTDLYGERRLALHYECLTSLTGSEPWDITLVSKTSPRTYNIRLEPPTMKDIYQEIEVSVVDRLEVPLTIGGVEQTVVSRMRRDQRDTLVLRANEAANFELFVKPQPAHQIKNLSATITPEFSFPGQVGASTLGYEKNDAVVSWRSVIFDQPIDDQGKSVILRLDRANIPGEAVDQLSEEKISTYRGYVRGTISYSDYHLPQNVTTPFGFRIVGPDVRDDVSVAFEQSIDNKLSRIVFRNMVDYDLKPLVIDLSATCSENPSQSVWTRIYGDRDPSGDPLRSQTKSILPGEKFAFEREILLRELQKSAQRQETRCSRFKIESMSVGEQYYLSTQRTKNISVPELYL